MENLADSIKNANELVVKILNRLKDSDASDTELLKDSCEVILSLNGVVLELVSNEKELMSLADHSIELADKAGSPIIVLALNELKKKIALRNKQSQAGVNRHAGTDSHTKLNLIEAEYRKRYAADPNCFDGGRLTPFYKEMEAKHTIDENSIKARITAYRKDNGHSKTKKKVTS